MFSIIPLKHRHHFSTFIMLYACIPAVYKNSNCDWLETVTCTSYIPPVMESFNAFSNAAYDNATLIVPDEAYYDYLQSYGWDMFENTKSAAIEDVFAETTAVADIFNLQGIIIKRNASKEDLHSLPTGIYIVNGKKIVVK